MILSGSLFATAVNDTVWWETPGGKVTEDRGPAGASCSLTFYDDSGSVVFDWADPGRTVVTAIDWSWEFPADWKMPSAMQLGVVWLSNGGGSAIIEAVGHGNALSFAVNQPVDDLLRPADHIAVRTTGAQLSIKLNHSKVGVLLSRAQQCRAAIGR
jgi:hypothetical protein